MQVIDSTVFDNALVCEKVQNRPIFLFCAAMEGDQGPQDAKAAVDSKSSWSPRRHLLIYLKILCAR